MIARRNYFAKHKGKILQRRMAKRNGVVCAWSLTWRGIIGRWVGDQYRRGGPVGERSMLIGSLQLYPYSVVLPRKNRELAIVSKDPRESLSEKVGSKWLKGGSLTQVRDGI